MKTFFINNGISIITLVLVLLFIFTGIFDKRNGNSQQGGRRDTTIILVQQPTQTAPQIIAIPGSTTAANPIPPQYVVIPATGNEKFEELYKKYQELLTRYNQLAIAHTDTNKYENKIILRDTAGRDVGNVELNQSVTENKLQPFSPRYTLKFPQVQITEHLPEKLRRQVYAGLQVGYTSPLTPHAMGSLIYKDKKENLYQLSYGATLKSPSPILQAGYYKLIKLKKR